MFTATDHSPAGAPRIEDWRTGMSSRRACGSTSTTGSTACCCAQTMSPTFRFPDLISASVSLVFTHQDAPARIFRFLGTELVLRSPETPRRRESMWRHQYQLLLDLQRSPANRTPTPSSSSTS